MTFEIFLTIFLVFLNGFFVAAEFAIVKVRSTQLSNLSGLSKNVTAAAKKVTSNLDGYLAATQLGITLASLGLGWVGEEMMTKIILTSFEALNISIPASTAHKIAIPVAFFCITVLHIVFGELAPKSIAIRKPAATTLLVAIPLQIFYVVFRPFIWMLNGFANSLLRLIGIPPAKEQDIHSEEELKLIIAESQEGGAIEETERQLIHNVFDFDDRRVKGILTHRKDIIALNAAMPFDELVDKVIIEGYSRYPVYNNSIDDLIGIIYTKDLVKGIHEKTIKSVNDILRPVFYIPDSMKIKVLLRNFQLNRQQLAIVTDEFGDTEGLVTMEDVLEQLVGDIQDEHDQEQPIVQQVNEHTFIVDAHQNIEEINEYLPKPLPSSDHYDTLSGLIAYYHGSIPAEGEVLQVEDYQLTILKMFKRSAERVQVVLSE